MIKYTVTVEGMQCGMCEAHVNDAVRKAFPVKKVNSSHSKNQTVIIVDQAIDEQVLKKLSLILDMLYLLLQVSLMKRRDFLFLKRDKSYNLTLTLKREAPKSFPFLY